MIKISRYYRLHKFNYDFRKYVLTELKHLPRQMALEDKHNVAHGLLKELSNSPFPAQQK